MTQHATRLTPISRIPDALPVQRGGSRESQLWVNDVAHQAFRSLDRVGGKYKTSEVPAFLWALTQQTPGADELLLPDDAAWLVTAEHDTGRERGFGHHLVIGYRLLGQTSLAAEVKLGGISNTLDVYLGAESPLTVTGCANLAQNDPVRNAVIISLNSLR